MAQVTLVLTDTPDAGVAVRTTFTPALGQPCTQAQSRCLDMLRLAKHEGDVIIGSPIPQIEADALAAALTKATAQRDVLARLLAKCIDPLRNLEAEGHGEEGLGALIEQADAALQQLASQAWEIARGHQNNAPMPALQTEGDAA